MALIKIKTFPHPIPWNSFLPHNMKSLILKIHEICMLQIIQESYKERKNFAHILLPATPV